MAKKRTRRSISVSRVTYERLKAFCESNNISMSQFVETRVGDFLGEGEEGAAPVASPVLPRPMGAVGHASLAGHADVRPMSGHAPVPRPALAAVGPAPVRPVAPAP